MSEFVHQTLLADHQTLARLPIPRELEASVSEQDVVNPGDVRMEAKLPNAKRNNEHLIDLDADVYLEVERHGPRGANVIEIAEAFDEYDPTAVWHSLRRLKAQGKVERRQVKGRDLYFSNCATKEPTGKRAPSARVERKQDRSFSPIDSKVSVSGFLSDILMQIDSRQRNAKRPARNDRTKEARLAVLLRELRARPLTISEASEATGAKASQAGYDLRALKARGLAKLAGKRGNQFVWEATNGVVAPQYVDATIAVKDDQDIPHIAAVRDSTPLAKVLRHIELDTARKCASPMREIAALRTRLEREFERQSQPFEAEIAAIQREADRFRKKVRGYFEGDA